MDNQTGKVSLGGTLLLGAVVVVVSFASINFARTTNFVSALWPSNAIVLVALARSPRNLANYTLILAAGWFAIFAANLASGNSFVLSTELAVANVFEIAVATMILVALKANLDGLPSLRSLSVLVLAAAIASFFGASLGAAAVAYANAAIFSQIWVNWYASDALGIIIVGPFMLSVSYEQFHSLRIKGRYSEAFYVLALIVFVSVLASYYRALIFAVAPAIFVAILRFRVLGAAVAILTVCFVIISFIVAGIGSPVLSQANLPERILAMQILLASTALWCYPVASMLQERDGLMAALDRANAQLQIDNDEKARMVIELHRSLLNAEERERLRLSHELHDQSGQSLVGALMELSIIEKQTSKAHLDRIQRVRTRIEEIIKSIHRVAWQMRPAAIDELGLESALGNYISDWSERFAIRSDFQCRDNIGIDDLSDEIRVTIYRVLGEALNNVAKHARGCTIVSVLMDFSPSLAQLTIEDDGCGFDATGRDPFTARNGGLGLAGMRERLMFVHGDLQIESSPGAGTTLFVRIPLAPAPTLLAAVPVNCTAGGAAGAGTSARGCRSTTRCVGG